MSSKNSKGFATHQTVHGFAPILILVILGIIGAAAYLIPKPQIPSLYPSPTPTAGQAPNGDLANWKTYRDEGFGFEFKYPSEWDYHPGIDSPAWGVSNNSNDSYFSISFYRIDPSCLKQKGYTYRGRTTWIEIKESEITINNRKASLIKGRAKWTGYSDPKLNREFDYKIALISKGLGCYDLSTQAYEGATDETRKILDQILSTFQFTDKD